MARPTFLSVQPKEERSEVRALGRFARCVIRQAVALTPTSAKMRALLRRLQLGCAIAPLLMSPPGPQLALVTQVMQPDDKNLAIDPVDAETVQLISIPMAKLDNLVTTHVTEQLFQPDRLAMILSSLASRRSEKADAVNARVIALQREVTDADDKLKRLYRLIKDGMTEMDDILKDRLNSLKADRDRAKAALERAKSHSSQAIRIDPALLEQFGRTMRDNFTSGSIPFRKAYLQSLIDVIEVGDTQIRINGSKDVLERAVLAQSGFADEY